MADSNRDHKKLPPPVVTVQDLDVEEAETSNFQSAEEKYRSASSANTVGFGPPPLKSALRNKQPTEQDLMVQEGNTERVKRMYLIKLAARKARAAPAAALLHDMQEAASDSFEASSQSLDIGEAERDGLMKILMPPQPRDPYGTNFDHHLLKAHSFERKRAYYEEQSETPLRHGTDKNTGLPLHGTDPTSPNKTGDYIATNPDGYVRQVTFAASPPNKKKPKRRAPRWLREVCTMLHPIRLFHNLSDILFSSYFVWVGAPCLLLAAIFYYIWGNPTLYFLPDGTSIAYWLLFVTRQTVTLGLARLTVFIFVDGFMLGTHLAVQTLGPLLTLAAATGKGWPLMLVTWGLWNLVLIHGYSEFQQNWLYWTEIELFNLNNGGTLVNGELYTRILFSAIIGGFAVIAKGTIFALRFGRKQFAEYKPRLEPVLADVVLLSEIATLAEQAEEEMEQGDVRSSSTWDPNWDLMSTPAKNLNEFLWSLDRQPSIISHVSSKDTHDDGSLASHMHDDPPRVSRQFGRSQSGRLKIREKLDSWEVPDDKTEKDAVISIHDILKFRRALTHLDEDCLFGDAFGCTNTRDLCIASSHSVYYRLLKLAPTLNTDDEPTDVLPYDVLALLCLEDDGETENLAKKRKIRKMFTPDRNGGVPLLAFIQTVDKAYKRLVFLRASLKNSYLLDGVLEKLANGLFYFVLILFLSSLMEMNPWALMVSITSILVSVSFALGSSVSRYVEGVLLIAVRRPFDLGDRIFMSSADSINPVPDVTTNSWFVEDITLATTTLRYAQTNEICTVNNWSISSTRIVNLARSSNAKVRFEFLAHICILDGDTFDKFKREMEQYVEERPRVWGGVVCIRHDKFDVDNEQVDVVVTFQHRNAWQDAGRIKRDRSEVFKFLYQLGKKLDIHFSSPVAKKVVYQGGALRHNANDDDLYSKDAMKSSNILPIAS